MKKRQEKYDAGSCWNSADDEEWTFILLARDPASPATIDAWIRTRLLMGLNNPDDPKLAEARACAEAMRLQYQELARRRLDEHKPNPDNPE